MLRAHRFAYALSKGEIPDGFVVRHTCDNPACCNPDHLILGTQADNIADMYKRKRNRKAKGEDNSNSKLTAKQAMEIYSSPLPPKQLAKCYSITETAVSKIKLKKRWKHLHS
tara:strand:- start:697 stop:1032 length:336 start_codon:yes stop_codon:yes gene_type:complete